MDKIINKVNETGFYILVWIVCTCAAIGIISATLRGIVGMRSDL